MHRRKRVPLGQHRTNVHSPRLLPCPLERMDGSELLYSRDLPGGGRVTIEALSAGVSGASRCRARVIVEQVAEVGFAQPSVDARADLDAHGLGHDR